MTDLLVEFHLVDGRADVTERAVPDAREKILRAYGVDSTTYVRALSYYADHPKEYSALYGRVIERLTDERMGTVSNGDSTLDLMTPSELGRLSP